MKRWNGKKMSHGARDLPRPPRVIRVTTMAPAKQPKKKVAK
jgi:hypothetical protein